MIHSNYLTLYNHTKVQKEIESERSEARINFLKQLISKGPVRSLKKCGNVNFDDLYESFPNFSDTLDRLSEQAALAALAPNAVFTLRPILLVGPPGVGKTRFVREVAKRLGFEFSNISCGGITAGWILSGSSISWSEGRPGMVHTTLRDGRTGNPIIMLDEIDKLAGDARFSGFGPLYQLLDREVSNNFADEAVGVPIDCSCVSWIATANNLRDIPEAIVSRLTVIEVDAPSPDQMSNVIKSIYSDILNENKSSWGGYFDSEVNEDMIDSLQNQSPRGIVKMLMTAIGRAARARGVTTKEASELIRLQSADFKDFKPRKMRIGF